MRLHRFYTNTEIGDSKQYTSTDESLINQLTKVFRYKTGQEVILFDNSGFEYTAVISLRETDQMVFDITEKREGLVPPGNVSVCFSLLKKDNNELIIQKCTELGVSEFFPVLSERSEKKALNMERAQKIVLEAAEQSGWAKVPVVHEPVSLEEVLENTKNLRQIVFHTETVMQKASYKTSTGTILFIGPEGGWTEGEIEMFKKDNVEFASLGASVLRGETAAIVGVAKFI